jgi:hypothetical protein
MCFEAQFIVHDSGIFYENEAGLCFFTIENVFQYSVYIYSLLIVLAITTVTSQGVEFYPSI